MIRGDLASILEEATTHAVQFCFGNCMSTMIEDVDDVHVTFRHGLPACHYGIVIGADGWHSTTRPMAFGISASTQAVRPLEQWVAWFTNSRMARDDAWTRWYAATGGGYMSDYRGVTLVLYRFSRHSSARQSINTTAKEFWKQLLVNMGWQEARILDGFHRAEDFSHLRNRTGEDESSVRGSRGFRRRFWLVSLSNLWYGNH